MTEENKFKEVDSIQLYNDYIGYVKLYDASMLMSQKNNVSGQ